MFAHQGWTIIVLHSVISFARLSPSICLDKCIHYKNQKQFVLFFFWMCFSLAVAMWSFHPYIMQEIRESEKLEYVQKLGRLNYFTTIFTWFYSSYLGESRLLRNLMIAIMAISSMLTYCVSPCSSCYCDPPSSDLRHLFFGFRQLHVVLRYSKRDYRGM